VITLVLLVISSAACGLLGGGNTDCKSNPAASWSVSLPPSAANAQERCAMNIVNPSYTNTFTMSPDDLESFQQSTLVTEWQTDPSLVRMFDDEAAQMDSLLVGSYVDGVILLEVVIDTSNPEQYRVYYGATFVD
jgi:hypothetical protein